MPRQPEELQELYTNSSFAQKISEQMHLEPELNTYTRKHATTKLTQFKMLMHRNLLSRLRDRRDMKVQLIRSVAIGLALGAVFFQKANLQYPFYEEVARTSELVPLPEVNSCISLIFMCTM